MTSSPKSSLALALNRRRTSTRIGSACTTKRWALLARHATPWMIPAAQAILLSVPTLPGAPTYDNYVSALVTAKCSACHGDLATAGLNMLTYTGIMKGGADGPVIAPGDSANSKLFQIQSAGGHFANLTAEELEIIKQWINAGAPEK